METVMLRDRKSIKQAHELYKYLHLSKMNPPKSMNENVCVYVLSCVAYKCKKRERVAKVILFNWM
jgi:hypothetical protein